MIRSLTITLLITLPFQSIAQSKKPADPLAHTFSIVARDEKTGEMAHTGKFIKKIRTGGSLLNDYLNPDC
ncbi:MAG: hypothetical protein ACYCZO_08595 [Daejeonella sp.]